MDESRPIFVQIAEQIEAQILDGSMPEETQVPSINELASFHRINPATALKGVNLLVDQQILYKKRGIGMFVARGSRASLLAKRRDAFSSESIRPLVARAAALGLSRDEIVALVDKEMSR